MRYVKCLFQILGYISFRFEIPAHLGPVRPVSILSNISKVYERCIYDQIQTYFDKILSKYQCGFRKGYNSQHCLIALIEKWKKKC